MLFYGEDCSIEQMIEVKGIDDIEIQFSPETPKLCKQAEMLIIVEGEFDSFQWEDLGENEPLMQWRQRNIWSP